MSKFIKSVLATGIAIVIIIGAYAIFRKNPSKENSNKDIKIGATLALTGNYAYLGVAEANGFKMAIDEINASGGINGRNLKIIMEDNQGDATKAVDNISKLANVDNADIFFSAFTHITEAIKSTVSAQNKVMLYASTVREIAEGNEMFFRDYYDAKDSGKALADFIGKNTSFKNIAFFTEISEQSAQVEEAFKEEAGKNGINVIAKESFPSTDKDLKTYLLKVKEANPEAIVVSAWRQESILMKQIKELDMINIPTLHWVAPFLPASDTEEMRKLYEENNTISTWYGMAEINNTQKQKDFTEKYQKLFGIKPTGESAYSYDDIYVLAEALSACDKEGQINNSDFLAKQLLKTNYDGVLGKLSFSDKGVSNRNVSMIRVENGLWKEISAK